MAARTIAAGRDPVARRRERNIALQETVEQHGGRLRSVIRGLIRDRDEAEDVLQDVFEEYIEAYDLGLAVERAGAWLAAVARNKVLDRFRRKKTRTAYEAEVRHTETESVEDDEMRSWLRDEIVEALEMLPREQREAFVMYELEGKSFKEIAAETGVPVGTLLARKKYAVDFLREHLKEIYDDDE